MASVNLERTADERHREPAMKPGTRARYNRLMRTVRRVHLYAGLIMTPWVFLYGVTACLFNHPALFPDQEIHQIGPATLAGTGLDRFPSAEEIAGQVVRALNADGSEEEEADEPYRLIRPDEARLTRDYSTTLIVGEEEHTVRLNLATQSGTIRTAPARVEPERPAPAPFASPRGPGLDEPPLDLVTQALPALLERVGLSTDGLVMPENVGGGRSGGGDRPRSDPERSPTERAQPGASRDRESGGKNEEKATGTVTDQAPRPPAPASPPGGPASRGGRFGGPELSFLMEGHGKVWRVGYDLQTGALSGTPESDEVPSEAPTTRRFLLRLHMAHGYPDQYNARWFWAGIVDVMSASMVGWGLTGLLMWWQMKNVRRVGAVVLLIGVVASVVAAIGMHGFMVSGV